MAEEAHLAELVKYDEEQTAKEQASEPRKLYTYAGIGLLIGISALFLALVLKKLPMLIASILGFAFFAWTFFEITMLEAKDKASFRNLEKLGKPRAVNYHLFHQPAKPQQLIPRTLDAVLGFPVKKSSGIDYERSLILKAIRSNPGKMLGDAYASYKAEGGTESYATFLLELKNLRRRGLIKIKRIVEI